ncbi:iron-containing alcohol dehydrogenase [Clostridium aminobutyricum]|uniref:Iron-containing alcohol dehydrogenase n=1 Tax=Clostridium aminobutyricum TaxID=33953 RepID=A0A939IHC2_CLOAM|nr:iron-containing alcohol dehydrogenase [Clostridium aminobutyricum]MBN7773562.1 iron-containing alcohol dehydrogenase [Clostridium aminobutyricum]
MSFNYYVPTRALFGAGMLNHLHEQAMPGKKAMIVISNGKSTKDNGYLTRTEEQLHMAGIETTVFDRIQPNPLKTTVEEGGTFARANSCDFIVALGGGSVMDASKAIAVSATNDGDLWDYALGKTGKAMPIKNKPLPIIAVTTTAGTGSETDAWGVITNVETHEKIGFGGIDELFPKIAIIDPELMTSVPPEFTAYQGFDAFFHSAEGYISKFANPMSDMVGITAIENVSRYLPKAVHDGEDMEAREKVAFGNYLSGIEMVVGSTSSQHSLEHALSAYHQELPHGAGLIILSKAYFTFFMEKHVCDERFIRMAKAMGKEDASRPEDFITMLTKLQEDCGVDDLKMSDYGIKPEEFETLAINAKATMGRLFGCDRVDLSVEDCVSIYAKSYR